MDLEGVAGGVGEVGEDVECPHLVTDFLFRDVLDNEGVVSRKVVVSSWGFDGHRVGVSGREPVCPGADSVFVRAVSWQSSVFGCSDGHSWQVGEF